MTKQPQAKMGDRRILVGDPEFPFWTTEPSRGHVVLLEGYAHVVCDLKSHENGLVSIDCRELDLDGQDRLCNKINVYFIKDARGEEHPIKVIDRLYYHGEGKAFQIDMIDYEPLAFIHRPLVHEDLPENHPLRNMPYWGAPGGKNLTITACLEWALMHLKFENGKLPCIENEETIKSLERAISLQKLRQQTRLEQGVLGTNKPHQSDPYFVTFGGGCGH